MAALTGKYVSLTSFRKDGSEVATAVWFVVEDGRVLVITDAESYKVRRIRRDPRVRLAPCTASGRLRGRPVDGRAEILPVSEVDRVERLILQKYRVDRWIVLPAWRLVRRLKGKPESGRSVILAITPGDTPV